MTKGNEASRAASQARKEKETTKKKEGKHETDSSDDSDDDKATEKAAQELRENEHKRRLAQANADSEITDRMIAQAEARNQVKKAKLKHQHLNCQAGASSKSLDSWTTVTSRQICRNGCNHNFFETY